MSEEFLASKKSANFKIVHEDASGQMIVDIASLMSYISVSISPQGKMIFTDQLTGEQWVPSTKEVNVHEHEQGS